MARRLVSSRRPFVRRQSNVSWGGIQIALTSIPLATKVILGSFVSATQFDETILRTRGSLLFVGAANAQSIMAIGMIVVSEDAFATGIGAIPGPVSDIGNDGWFYWQALVQGADAVSHPGGIFNVDNKGKRIVREGSRIAIIGEGAASPATGAGLVTGYLRVLGMFRS